jgi:hypothetical protein
VRVLGKGEGRREKGEGDYLYYHFEEAFRGQASSGILNFLETDGFLKLHDIVIEIGTPSVLTSCIWMISSVMLYFYFFCLSRD